MNHIFTIMEKQRKDTLKNKTVLIQFLMLPLLCILMEKTVQIEGMPENFFVNLFASMYLGMAPLTTVSAIISEEKEKNTLRVLLMADVSPAQYLLGIGSYVFLACMLGGGVFCCLLDGKEGEQRMLFLLIMAIGVLASVMAGAAIGVGSKNQMAATAVTVPVMMLFSFLPMLSMFNETLAKVAKLTYSGQIKLLIDSLGNTGGTGNAGNAAASIAVIVLNMVLFGAVFSVRYRKRGLA